MAVVVREFKGCRDGELIPRTFAVGDVVEGALANIAIEQGWAEGPESKKKPPRDKSAKPPRDKSGGSSQPDRVSRR